MTAKESTNTELAEIWGDTVNLKHLAGAMVIGAVLGFCFFYGGLQAIKYLYPDIQKSLQEALALLVGIVGCLLAAIISARLFPPKRFLIEQEVSQEDREQIIHELQIDIEQELKDMETMPKAILDEMRELKLLEMFQPSPEKKEK